jgi:hypothetical protein
MKLITFWNEDGVVTQTVEIDEAEIEAWLADVLPRVPSGWTHEISEIEASE